MENPNDTPRTDAHQIDLPTWQPDVIQRTNTVPIEFARQLERELNEANRKLYRIEREDSSFSKLPLNKRLDESLADAVERNLGLTK